MEESIWQNGEEKLRLEEDVTDFDGSVAARLGEKRRKPTDEAENDDDKGKDQQQQPQLAASGKRLNQGEIFKFLSDALSYGGGASANASLAQSPGLRTPRPHQ